MERERNTLYAGRLQFAVSIATHYGHIALLEPTCAGGVHARGGLANVPRTFFSAARPAVRTNTMSPAPILMPVFFSQASKSAG